MVTPVIPDRDGDHLFYLVVDGAAGTVSWQDADGWAALDRSENPLLGRLVVVVTDAGTSRARGRCQILREHAGGERVEDGQLSVAQAVTADFILSAAEVRDAAATKSFTLLAGDADNVGRRRRARCRSRHGPRPSPMRWFRTTRSDRVWTRLTTGW